MRDWKHFSSIITEHINTLKHIESCGIFELWKKNQTIDKELEEKTKYEISFWKLVLFHITLVLAKNCLSFRGHRENLEHGDVNGSFLTLVQLLSNYEIS